MFSTHLTESAELLQALLRSDTFLKEVERAKDALVKCVQEGGTIFIAGNGGSAADAQHFSAELVVRFSKTREGIAAHALATDTSILTAAGNDLGFEQVFARQIQALGKKGDACIFLSTSGKSENLIIAADVARARMLTVIGLLGMDGGTLRGRTDVSVTVRSSSVARIQEVHTMILHYFSEVLESYAQPSH